MPNVGRPKGSKTILNFSKLKAEGLKRLFDSLGMSKSAMRFITTMPEKRRFLKSLITGDDFKNLQPITGASNWQSLPYHIKMFYYMKRDAPYDEIRKKINTAEKKQQKNFDSNYNNDVGNDDLGQELKKQLAELRKKRDELAKNVSFLIKDQDKDVSKKELMEKLNKFVDEENK